MSLLEDRPAGMFYVIGNFFLVQKSPLDSPIKQKDEQVSCHM